MNRNTFLNRNTPLKRSPMPSTRSKRPPDVDGPQADLCRTLSCENCGVEPIPFEVPTVAHHVRHVANGGKDEDTAPLCWVCHELLHSVGWQTWIARGCPDLRPVADTLALEVHGEEYDEESLTDTERNPSALDGAF